jgi:hypothetical protein
MKYDDEPEVVAGKPRKKRRMKPRSKWKPYRRPGHGELQTEKELAATLGEVPKTIRHWRVNGIIPYMMLGHKSIRYRLDAVLAALEKRTVKRRKLYEQPL